MLEDFLELKLSQIDQSAELKKKKAQYLVKVLEEHLPLMDKVVEFRDATITDSDKTSIQYQKLQIALDTLLNQYSGPFICHYTTEALLPEKHPSWQMHHGRIWPASSYVDLGLNASLRLGWAQMTDTQDYSKPVYVRDVNLSSLFRILRGKQKLATTEEEIKRWGPKPHYRLDLTDKGREVLNGYLAISGELDVESRRKHLYDILWTKSETELKQTA